MLEKHITRFPDHSDNKLWEKLDYSDEKEGSSTIYSIITSECASPKTIARIIQTAKADADIEEACQHEYAQIEDIIKAIHRFKNYPIEKHRRRIVNSMINISLFGVIPFGYNKREEFAVYLKNNYNVDIDIMPEELIKQMLQIEDMETNA
jgi:hypothetical protein